MASLILHRRRLIPHISWPKVPKLTPQDVLNLISRTENIDDLSRIEYENIIEYYITNKISSIIGSSDIAKIKIILRYMFSSAENVINIYSEKINEVINDSKVIETIDRALENNIELNIIVNSIPYNSQIGDLIRDKLSYKKKINLYILNNEIEDNNKNVIVTIDSTMYYEQNNSLEAIGVCNFYSPEKTIFLENKFKELLNKSSLVK